MHMDIGTTHTTSPQQGALEVRRRHPRVRDWFIGIFAGAFMTLLFGHELVPEAGGIALFIESFLPWLGGAITVLLMVALLSKAWFGALPVVVAAASWGLVFFPILTTGTFPASADSASEGGAEGLTVVTQNLRAGNPDAEAAVERLIKSDADVVVLQELTGPALARISPLMDGAFDHRQLAGTVGVWSRLPLGRGEPLTLGLGWSRAVRVQLQTPAGPVQLYAVHLPSVRPGEVSSRNNGLAKLAELVAADRSPRILVVGDFNTATTDRAFAPLLATLDDARAGFGFTWPAHFPSTRLDHILYRGFTPNGAGVIASPGTDHLAALARLLPASDPRFIEEPAQENGKNP